MWRSGGPMRGGCTKLGDLVARIGPGNLRSNAAAASRNSHIILRHALACVLQDQGIRELAEILRARAHNNCGRMFHLMTLRVAGLLAMPRDRVAGQVPLV